MSLVPESVIIVGGGGAVGHLFSSLLRTKCKRLAVMDVRGPIADLGNDEFICADITDDAAIGHWQDFDLVLLSVPEHVALRFIHLLTRLPIKEKCFVDTLSVKSAIVNHWQPIKRHNEVLSINPMFGPSLGFKNQSVSYIDIETGPKATWLLNQMREAQCELVEFDAQTHDQYAAATQALTHAAIIAFGLALKKMTYDVGTAKSMWTPPHKTMLALLARILSADAEVYRDIQTSNPFAGEARTLLLESLRDLDRLVATDDAHRFKQTLSELDAVLGDSKLDMADLCRRVFRDL